ncbi:MAG: ubiquinol-cytochrome c reductase iron-sulfur subunit [Rickettsiaceae bacterium]|nr:ubiquinol-cytochrome c reductase iron-sulfur subunit [Rickettsiaceae bacterium]
MDENKIAQDPQKKADNKIGRRDFMVVTACSSAAIGAACALWPLIDSFNPAADVLAESTLEYDLSNIQVGQEVVIKWRGKPVFISRRSPDEIASVRAVDINTLPDPQRDEDRVKPGHDEWLVTIGICTHLGCVPIGKQGDYDGWFCPCHGSQYDASGRIRQGPAPKNLEVPPYSFISDTKIKIG